MATLAVHVSPRSARDQISGWKDAAEGRPELQIKLTAAPTDGKANEALIRLLARELAVPKSGITIKRGQTSRHKLLEIRAEQSSIDERLRRFS